MLSAVAKHQNKINNYVLIAYKSRLFNETKFQDHLLSESDLSSDGRLTKC